MAAQVHGNFSSAGGLERLAGYVRYVADRMNLRDWQFFVESAPDNDDPLRIRCVPRRKLATIEVGPAFHEAAPEDQRHFVVHELIHPHHEPARSCIDTVERAVGESAYRVMKLHHDDALERAGDELARALAAAMPTPEQWAAATGLAPRRRK